MYFWAPVGQGTKGQTPQLEEGESSRGVHRSPHRQVSVWYRDTWAELKAEAADTEELYSVY